MVRIPEQRGPQPFHGGEPTPKSAELNRSVEMTSKVVKEKVLLQYSPTRSTITEGVPKPDLSAGRAAKIHGRTF